MLAPIQFDDETGRMTQKVSDIVIKGGLKPEFCIFKLAIAKSRPEQGFSVGFVSSQFSCDGSEALLHGRFEPLTHCD